MKRFPLFLLLLLITVAIFFSYSRQNSQSKQVDTSTFTPIQESGLQQVKVPIWSEEDFEEALKNLERAGGKEICWMNPRDTSPFYDGPVPLVYFVLFDITYSFVSAWIPYCRCFSEFRNVYLYGDRFGIAKGARTFDKFDRVVAEARFLRHLGKGKFEIEEFHYMPSAKSKTRSREVKKWGLRFQEPDGKLIFKCKSQFWGGSKIREEEISGEKVRDYYFIWSSGLYGLYGR